MNKLVGLSIEKKKPLLGLWIHKAEKPLSRVNLSRSDIKQILEYVVENT